ncbi:MAG: SEC10/PgrA surface exclusion domain-containing protein, partial [Streptococcus dysgalactiae]|nr:SEC10/PgrA surface exclusion domain-containing protein [Streptococcus dysgalactiae]
MTSKHTKVMLTSAALLTAVLSTTVQAQSENVGNLHSVKTVTASKDQQPLAQHIEDQEKVVTELTEKVQTAKKNDEAAAQAVEQAKANEASASDIETQKAEVAEQLAVAEKDVEAANQVVVKETKDVEDAQAANQQAQEALKSAESEAGHVETVKQASKVTLDGDFAEALGRKGQPDYSTDLEFMGGDNQFVLVTNPGDEQTVDIDNLTNEQLTDLSHYTASMINQVRNQARKAGVPVKVGNVIVTEGAVKFAKDVAQNYRNDNWNTIKDAHDIAAINKAAADNGLKVAPNQNAYEDAGMSQSSTFMNRTFTMEDLKRRILEIIGGMISKDANSDWKHTESLVGTGVSGEYLGVALSRVGDVVTVHVLQVPKSRIQDANKFDTNKLLNPYQGEVDPKAKEVLAQLESARTFAAGKAEALVTQQSKLQAAKSRVAELTNKVSQLKEQQAQLGKTVDVSTLVSS